MVELTKKERELLNKIMDDKYSVGAFTGHVHKLVVEYQTRQIEKTPEQVIKDALKIRLIAEDMAQGTEPQQPDDDLDDF